MGLGGLPSSTGPAFWPWNVSIVFANESFKGQKVLSQHPNLHLLVIEGMGTCYHFIFGLDNLFQAVFDAVLLRFIQLTVGFSLSQTGPQYVFRSMTTYNGRSP
jgi:hypothetical protein